MSYTCLGLYIGTNKVDPANPLKQLCVFLDKNKIEYYFERESYQRLPENIRCDNHKLFSADDDNPAIDLLVVVGGDGSFLHACKLFQHRNIPLTGINLGRLGFLTDISFDKLDAMLGVIMQGQGRIETRYFIDGQIDSNKYTSLNDFVIQTSKPASIIDLEVTIDNGFAFELRCDGIIVSSSTGSTAYGLSAGGPLLHPKVAAIVVVPLAAHALTARPCVIPDDKPLAICNKSKYQTAMVSVDGEPKMELGFRKSVIISKSNLSISLVHHPDYDYFAACRSKLGWHT